MRSVLKIILVITALSIVGLTLMACGARDRRERLSARDMTPTPTLPPLPTLDPGEVALGQQVYVEHCAACHGQSAEGQPNWKLPDANCNRAAPPHDDSGHTWHHADGLLYEITRDGFRDPLKPPDSPLTMPAFGDKLNDAEIRAVLTYFKSLWTEESRLFQWEVSQRQPFPTATPTGGQ